MPAKERVARSSRRKVARHAQPMDSQSPIPEHSGDVVRRAQANPDSLQPADMVQLQQLLGNQGTQRLLAGTSRPSPAAPSLQRQTTATTDEVTPLSQPAVITPVVQPHVQRGILSWIKNKFSKPKVSAPTGGHAMTPEEQGGVPSMNELIAVFQRTLAAAGPTNGPGILDEVAEAVGFMFNNAESEKPPVKDKPSESPGILDEVAEAVGEMFKSAEAAYEALRLATAKAALKNLQDGKIVAIEIWQLMKEKLPPDEYQAAIKALDEFKGSAAEKKTFLENVPPDKLGLFQGAIPVKPRKEGDATLEEAIKTSANPKRAEQALLELKAKRDSNDKSKERLTDAIIELLVWGIANRRDASDLGGEGIIGIDQALNAADALIGMKLPLYLDIVMKLSLTGGVKTGWDQQQLESVLILKSVAARKSKYLDDAKSEAAQTEVDKFSGDIRGMDADALKQATSTRDIGGGTGLQQKFTMSCGPTSIQIVRGEADPIYALNISNTAKHDLNYQSSVGAEQEKLLGKDAAPRTVATRWKAFLTAIGGGVTIDPKDVAAAQAVLNWMGGGAADAKLVSEGKKVFAAIGYDDAILGEFKKYFKGLQTEPGLGVADFQDRVKAAELAGVTNVKYPLKQFTKASPMQDADLDTVWKVLFRGNDVLFGVYWTGGGGHYMTLTDCQGEPPTGGDKRKFLLSDPWEGTSEWITADDLKTGKFGSAGTGWVDDIYYDG